MSESDINSVTERESVCHTGALKLEQTRGRDHDSCDDRGEAREQQQIMQDDDQRKSPYAAPSNRSEQYRRQGDERGEKQEVVQGTDGHRSPALCSIMPVAHAKILAKT